MGTHSHHVHAKVDYHVSDAKTSSRCLVYLDEALTEKLGAAAGDLVSLLSDRGRSILARLGPPEARQVEPETVCLDRFLRQGLKARLHESIEVEPAPQDCGIEKVYLLPAIDVTTAHDLIPSLHSTLCENQTPLSVNSVVYIPFAKSNAGTTYEVTRIEGAPGVVSAETVIELEYVDSHLPEGSFDTTFEDVGGLDRQVRQVRELVQLPLQLPHVYRQLGINPPRGIILFGAPGTGKTLLAKAVANEIQARFYYINGPDIIGTFSGETEGNLRRLFGEASHHSPSIIFIDELDAIAPKRGETGAHSDTRVVTQLLALMDGLRQVDGVMVISTTNRIDTVDAALRRPGRFDREIFFGPPDTDSRLGILEIHTREMPLDESALVMLPEVARRSYGFVGADLMELAREAGLNALRRNTGEQGHTRLLNVAPEQISVGAADFEAALSRVQPSALRETLIAVPNVTWDDVGGYDELKRRLVELIEQPLRKPGLFAEMALSTHAGILLHGPPGTGKTLLAKAIANECQLNFIALEGPEMFSKWLGESEEGVRHVFRIARQVAPVVVFFDQLDALVPVRGDYTGAKTTERVVNQLLTELDGIVSLNNVIVVGATNRIELIDPSVLRPGRFGTHLLVPLPSLDDRRAILEVQLHGVDIQPQDDRQTLLDELAEQTEGCSGATLKLLSDSAKNAVLRETEFERSAALERRHFETALAELRSAELSQPAKS